MTMPAVYEETGLVSGTTSSVSVAPGTIGTGFVCIVAVQTANQPLTGVSASWTLIASTGTGTAGSSGSVWGGVYWCRESGGTVPTFTANAPGDHWIADRWSIQNCATSGNIVNFSTTATVSTAQTAASMALPSSTVGNCLCIEINFGAISATTFQGSTNIADASLTSVGLFGWVNDTVGVGGGLYAGQGNKVTAGACGTLNDDNWASATKQANVAFAISDTATVSFSADEDYWTNVVGPGLAGKQAQFTPFGRTPNFGAWEELPAGSFLVAPAEDEDLWINPVPPARWLFRAFSPNDVEEVPAGALFGQDDEDFWVNPVAPAPPVIRVQLPIGDPEELPAGAFFGQPDEDLWRNPVTPAPWLLRPFPPSDVEELAAGSLFGQPDEDFWFNPVPEVPATVRVQLPLGDPEEELPAGALYGQDDEDFWFNPVAPASWVFRPLSPADVEEIPAGGLFGQDDEDYRATPVAPLWWPAFTTLPLSDPPDTVAVAGSSVQDEDLWQAPIVPPASSQRVPVTFADTDEMFAGASAAIVDDDVWGSQMAVARWSFWVRPASDGDDLPAVVLPVQDEDLWRAPAIPAPWVFRPASPSDVEELSAGALFGQDDEDFWINPVQPAFWSFRAFSPLDVEELPAATLAGQPDEDFWTNQVAPAWWAMRVQLPLGDPEEELPAGFLYGQPIEDVWPVLLPPQVAGFRPLAAVDTDGVPPLIAGQPDEDTWRRPTLMPLWMPPRVFCGYVFADTGGDTCVVFLDLGALTRVRLGAVPTVKLADDSAHAVLTDPAIRVRDRSH